MSIAELKASLSDMAQRGLDAAKVDEGCFAELLSPNGASLIVKNMPSDRRRVPTTARLAIKTDEVFLSIYSETEMRAFHLKKGKDIQELKVWNRRVEKLSHADMTHVSIRVFGYCTGEAHTKPVIFKATELRDEDAVKAFFKGNEGMLPESLRKQWIPQKAAVREGSPNPPNEPPSRWGYVVGGVLAALLVGALARRYIKSGHSGLPAKNG